MTEINNPNDILRVVVSSLLILNIIRPDKIVIKTKYKGYANIFNICKFTSVSE